MSEEKPEKRGFGIFDRRHSANTFGVRRSVSNVGFFSSRRNSTPTTQLTSPTPPTATNGTSSTSASPSTSATTPASGPMYNGGASYSERKNSGSGIPPGKRHIRAEKWQLLARKVLGNLDEEDAEMASAVGNENHSLLCLTGSLNNPD